MDHETSNPLNRREALTRVAAIVGGVIIVGAGGVAACGGEKQPQPAAPVKLGANDRALLEEIADTLLPTTPASPGAKAAGAGQGIALLLDDCYDAEQQRKVARGLGEFRSMCRTRCGAGFASLAAPDRERVLRDLDAEAKKAGDAHWFHLVRELSERAYFSSEVGMTKALRWTLVPGRWKGCVPLEPGQPAWG